MVSQDLNYAVRSFHFLANLCSVDFSDRSEHSNIITKADKLIITVTSVQYVNRMILSG